MKHRVIALLIPIVVHADAALLASDWAHYAGNPARVSVAASAPRSLDSFRWFSEPHADEEFVARSSPVAAGGVVIVNARVFDNDGVQVGNRLIALDAETGARAWQADLAADVLDSWSSPAIDTRSGSVVAASDATLSAFDLSDGSFLWEAALPASVVNASPVVTNDLANGGIPANRVFITDHAPFGSGHLLAVNIDPFVPTQNPYHPGEIAWTRTISGTSGATPAYSDGIIFVASSTGMTLALHAADGTPLWSRQTSSQGFFGGVCVTGGAVYAATYNFNGGQNNSRLYKLSASTGQTIWSIPSERTSSIPVLTPDGRIFLSGGITGFGSAVKVQAFRDLGSSAVLLWDTFASSGGALIMGGWSHEPVFSHGYVYVGRPDDTSSFGAYDDLYVINASLNPASAGFVVSHFSGAGGTPAVVSGRLYSIGPAGLYAFGRMQRVNEPFIEKSPQSVQRFPP